MYNEGRACWKTEERRTKQIKKRQQGKIPPRQISRWISYAEKHKETEPDKVLGLLKIAEAKRPNNFSILDIMAQCLFSLNRLKEAESKVRKSIQYGGGAKSFSILTNILVAQGRLKEARGVAYRAVKIDHSPKSYELLIYVLGVMCRFDEVEWQIRLNIAQNGIHINLLEILLGRKKYYQAEMMAWENFKKNREGSAFLKFVETLEARKTREEVGLVIWEKFFVEEGFFSHLSLIYFLIYKNELGEAEDETREALRRYYKEEILYALLKFLVAQNKHNLNKVKDYVWE